MTVMANSKVITKLEYRFKGVVDFIEMSFTNYPDPISRTSENTKAGIIFTDILTFKTPKCTDETDSLLKSLASHLTIWQVSYSDDTVDAIRTDELPARLKFVRMNGGQPGNYNGYEISVQAKSV